MQQITIRFQIFSNSSIWRQRKKLLLFSSALKFSNDDDSFNLNLKCFPCKRRKAWRRSKLTEMYRRNRERYIHQLFWFFQGRFLAAMASLLCGLFSFGPILADRLVWKFWSAIFKQAKVCSKSLLLGVRQTKKTYNMPVVLKKRSLEAQHLGRENFCTKILIVFFISET